MKKPAIMYFYVKVSSLVKAIDFFRNKLNLPVDGSSREQLTAAVVIYNPTTHIILSENLHPKQTSKVLLSTDDCLEQYCRLKINGVDFKEAPRYLPIGLLAEFMDVDGNNYLLLESRNYLFVLLGLPKIFETPKRT